MHLGQMRPREEKGLAPATQNSRVTQGQVPQPWSHGARPSQLFRSLHLNQLLSNNFHITDTKMSVDAVLMWVQSCASLVPTLHSHGQKPLCDEATVCWTNHETDLRTCIGERKPFKHLNAKRVRQLSDRNNSELGLAIQCQLCHSTPQSKIFSCSELWLLHL